MRGSLLSRLSLTELHELLHPAPRAGARLPNVVLLQWCPRCSQWMREGSAVAGHCVDCGLPGCPELRAIALREQDAQ